MTLSASRASADRKSGTTTKPSLRNAAICICWPGCTLRACPGRTSLASRRRSARRSREVFAKGVTMALTAMEHPRPVETFSMPNRTDWVAFGSKSLRARVDPLGAQLSELADAAGRPLLWSGDPAVWSGRAPLLFPIVGALAGGRYRLGAEHYALSRHGFARTAPFEMIESTPLSATFRLRSDENTRGL